MPRRPDLAHPWPHTVSAGTPAEVPARHRGLVATVEAAGTAVQLHEVAGGAITEAPRKGDAAGRLISLDIIRSGWNSSGTRYYPAEVLERDIPKCYPGGSTHMHVDHPSASEADDRPERSLTTLAAVFTDTPHAVREADGTVVMRTTARVFGPWQGFIAEAWEHIGVSINGHGSGDYGTREGREGLILDALTHGQSVDFVTRPGAGGRVLGLLESARGDAGQAVAIREAATLGAYLESRMHLGFTQLADDLYGNGRLTRDERIILSGAVGDGLSAFVARVEKDAPQVYERARWSDPVAAASTSTSEAAIREATTEETRQVIDRAVQAAHGGPNRYAWVQDYDPDTSTVWYVAGTAASGGQATWQQSYTLTAGTAELTGTPVEVRPRTVYEPVATTTPTTEARGPLAGPEHPTKTPDGDPPSGSPTAPEATNTTRENDMGEKSPEVVAREAAEARAAEAIKTSEADRLELARYKAGDAARPILDALLTESTLSAPSQNRIRAEFEPAVLPLLESTRALDEAKFRTDVGAAITAEAAYVAELLEAAGAGRVQGAGNGAGASTGMPTSFGSAVTKESAAQKTSTATREALVDRYKARGMTEAAALAAAAGRN